MYLDKWLMWSSLVLLAALEHIQVFGADDYNLLNTDGSYQFGYDNPDSFHHSQANRNNVVLGKFGSRNPGTGAIDTTDYTAGPRGFRPRGKNVVRKYNLNQNGPRPVGSRDDPYFDPSEDPSYSFGFRTGPYTRQESANRLGDVTGKYSYFDDIGERHNVEFVAGKNTGFHVKTPFPDSNPRAYGPLYFRGRGKPIPRGRTSIQRGLDGSYRFISTGPDQRRTETSDSTGHVRGSYTYLDDKNVQHSVHYIAGPETGYRVLKNVKGPHLPTVFPFGRPDIIPSDFYDYLRPGADDVFATAESGPIKPPKGGGSKPTRPGVSGGGGDQFNFDNGSDISGGNDGGFGDDFGKPGPSTGSGISGSGFAPSGTGPDIGGSDNFGTGPSGSDSGVTGPTGGSDGFGSKPGGSNSRPGGIGSGGSSFKPSGSGFKPGGSGGTSRPPFGPARPQRPSYEDDGTDFDLFGSTSSSPFRPPSGTQKPPGGSYVPATGGGPSSDGSFPDDGSYRPTGDDGSYRPGVSGGGSSGPDSGKPNGGDIGKPGSSGRPGSVFPKPGGSKPGKPNYDDDGSSSEGGNDFNLFGGGSDSTQRPTGPSVTSRPPGSGTHIGISHTGDGADKPGSGGSYDGRGTIVTNVGDRLFSVPPGVSVRAHVQAIDLLPLGPRSPSPSEQLKAESNEQLAESSNISEEVDTEANESNTTLSPSNATEVDPLPL